jgi:hypothetical protein
VTKALSKPVSVSVAYAYQARRDGAAEAATGPECHASPGSGHGLLDEATAMVVAQPR